VGAKTIVTKDVPDGATVLGINNIIKSGTKESLSKEQQASETWYYEI
jgi:serine acetyltransferase